MRASDKRLRAAWTISARKPISSSLDKAATSALRSFLVCSSSILLATNSSLRSQGEFRGLFVACLCKGGLSGQPAPLRGWGELLMLGLAKACCKRASIF